MRIRNPAAYCTVGLCPLPDIESNDTELSAMSASMDIGRAVDPDSLNSLIHSLNQDPDPAFQVNPNLVPIRIQGLMTKNCNLCPSLQNSKENLTTYFYVRHFALLDPDPLHWI
jgi:hypothetical protein